MVWSEVVNIFFRFLDLDDMVLLRNLNIRIRVALVVAQVFQHLSVTFFNLFSLEFSLNPRVELFGFLLFIGVLVSFYVPCGFRQLGDRFGMLAVD